jgi:hypothetical protein
MISANRRKLPHSYQQAPVDIFVRLIFIALALRWFPDRSWKREHRQEKIGLGVEAATGDTSSPI